MSKTDPALRNENGVWFYGPQKASGFILEQRGDALISKLPVVDGREHGLAYGWFESGEKRYERRFKAGNRHGEHRVWYRNGRLAGVSVFVDDKLEGEQRSYFESGALWKTSKYLHGSEEGVQKSWNESGRVVNNFTVRDGRLYGVVGRYDCMSVMSDAGGGPVDAGQLVVHSE